MTVQIDPHQAAQRFEARLGVTLLFVLPFALLVADNEWIFSPPGSIDPWVYTGFFLNLKLLLRSFGHTYYAGRLAWILPGALAQSLLGPVPANYVLHLTFYALAVGGLYIGLKELLGRRVALFTALLMGGYSHFLGAIGWDYVDGAGITYYVLTFALLTCAAKGAAWRALMIAGGATCALAVYSNLFQALLMPLLALHYCFANSVWRRNRVLDSALLAAIGFISVTIFLCVMSWLFNGPPVFFLDSLTVGASLVSHPNSGRIGYSIWVPRAGWLLLPLLTLLATIPVLASRLRRLNGAGGEGRLLLLLSFEFLGACAIMVTVELAGTPVLQLSYYASYLIPSVFIAVAALLVRPLGELAPRTFAAILVASVSLLLAPFFLDLVLHTASLNSRSARALAALLILCGGAVLLTNAERLRPLALCLLIAAFSIISHATGVQLTYGRAGGITNKVTYLSAVRAARAIQEVTPGVIPSIWYDATCELGHLQTAVASTYLWGYVLVNTKLPHLDREDLQRVAARRFLLVMSADEAVIQRAQQTLVESGFRPTRVSDVTIDEAPVRFKLAFFRMDAPAAMPGAQ